jgi:hypothetical protein
MLSFTQYFLTQLRPDVTRAPDLSECTSPGGRENQIEATGHGSSRHYGLNYQHSISTMIPAHVARMASGIDPGRRTAGAASVEQARDLAARAGTPASFVVADVFDAPGVLGRGHRVAQARRTAVAHRRPPGAVGALAEPLPADGTLVLDLPYFEPPEPLTWTSGGTYVQTSAVFAHTTTHEWNHGLGETVTALLAAGLQVTGLTEHDCVPWEALPGQMTRGDDGQWRLTERPWRLPLSYTLQAVRPG